VARNKLPTNTPLTPLGAAADAIKETQLYYHGPLSESGVPHGDGRVDFSDGSLCYRGSFINGMPSGNCELHYLDGTWYDGEMVDGKPHGKGCMVYSDRSSYVGQWQRGAYQGIGRHTTAYGKVREGQWEASQAVGFGVQWSAEGKMLACGKWTANRCTDTQAVHRRFLMDDSRFLTPSMRKAGLDILLAIAGYYSGGLDDAKERALGYGVLYTADGAVLGAGTWVAGKLHGQGHIEGQKSSYYRGEVFHGHADGMGIRRSVDGSILAGTNSDGYGGKSYLMPPNQRVFDGVVFDKEGKLVKVGRWRCGVLHEGPVPLSQLPPRETSQADHVLPLPPLVLPQLTEAQAKATLLFPGGSCYTGAINEAFQRHGQGIMHAADGTELQRGLWCEDKWIQEQDDTSMATKSQAAAAGAGAGAGAGASTNNPKAASSSLDCVVCLDRPRDCLLSCRHLVMCSTCATQLDTCPICSLAITQRTSVFFS
jgi:hypothetical protein